LIDAHCHLAHSRLLKQADAVLSRARDAGLVAVVCAAADLQESAQAAALADAHEDVYFTAGVHPHEAKAAVEDYPDRLERLCAHPRNVAIGEIGLDYHYDFSPRDAQRQVFERQLELAVRIGKPVVIHTREAFDDTMAILRRSGVDGARVVFHSFTEPPASVKAVLDFGAMVSFSGIVTFKRSDELRASARVVPDDRLLIETDSPYLAPEPVRKIRTNEPANVAHVAACLAGVRAVEPDAIAELTTANAARIFGMRP